MLSILSFDIISAIDPNPKNFLCIPESGAATVPCNDLKHF